MKKDKNFFLKMSSKNFVFLGLIVIFAILLLQSSITLFVDVTHEGLSQIDVVFRTSLSSIFGYIMSMVSTGEFTLKEKNNKVENKPKTIGFSADKTLSPTLTNNESKDKNISLDSNPLEITSKTEEKIIKTNVQIVTLTCVCIFCLLIMLIVRNFSHLIVANSTNSVTISMYRDIISGSVGALIGLSRVKS